MSEPEIRDETLIALLKERGYRVEKQEDEGRSLAEKIDRIEAKLTERSESPEEERQRLAEALLGALNRSRTPWIEPGGPDAA
jgi:hypothetical protein